MGSVNGCSGIRSEGTRDKEGAVGVLEEGSVMASVVTPVDLN